MTGTDQNAVRQLQDTADQPVFNVASHTVPNVRHTACCFNPDPDMQSDKYTDRGKTSGRAEYKSVFSATPQGATTITTADKSVSWSSQSLKIMYD